MRIIFLGTPDFAITSLKALLESGKHEILAVITQPDKPANRGGKMQPSDVKVFAQKQGLKVLEFEKISRDGVDVIKKLNPDVMVTCAYGQLLSQAIIDIPKYGIINVHASILPKYRGASPIQSAIVRGEKTTGVTIMQTDIGLDSGDVLAVGKTDILPDETAGELSVRLADIGSKLLLETLDKIADGTVTKIKQISTDATFTTKISKTDCIINWNKSAMQIKNLILGANPAPIASTTLGGVVVKIYRAVVSDVVTEKIYPNGKILPCSSAKTGLFVACGNGVLQILEAQLPGGKVLDAKQLISGRKIKVGDTFESVAVIGE